MPLPEADVSMRSADAGHAGWRLGVELFDVGGYDGTCSGVQDLDFGPRQAGNTMLFYSLRESQQGRSKNDVHALGWTKGQEEARLYGLKEPEDMRSVFLDQRAPHFW